MPTNFNFNFPDSGSGTTSNFEGNMNDKTTPYIVHLKVPKSSTTGTPHEEMQTGYNFNFAASNFGRNNDRDTTTPYIIHLKVPTFSMSGLTGDKKPTSFSFNFPFPENETMSNFGRNDDQDKTFSFNFLGTETTDSNDIAASLHDNTKSSEYIVHLKVPSKFSSTVSQDLYADSNSADILSESDDVLTESEFESISEAMNTTIITTDKTTTSMYDSLWITPGEIGTKLENTSDDTEDETSFAISTVNVTTNLDSEFYNRTFDDDEGEEFTTTASTSNEQVTTIFNPDNFTQNVSTTEFIEDDQFLDANYTDASMFDDFDLLSEPDADEEADTTIVVTETTLRSTTSIYNLLVTLASEVTHAAENTTDDTEDEVKTKLNITTKNEDLDQDVETTVIDEHYEDIDQDYKNSELMERPIDINATTEDIFHLQLATIASTSAEGGGYPSSIGTTKFYVIDDNTEVFPTTTSEETNSPFILPESRPPSESSLMEKSSEHLEIAFGQTSEKLNTASLMAMDEFKSTTIPAGIKPGIIFYSEKPLFTRPTGVETKELEGTFAISSSQLPTKSEKNELKMTSETEITYSSHLPEINQSGKSTDVTNVETKEATSELGVAHFSSVNTNRSEETFVSSSPSTTEHNETEEFLLTSIHAHTDITTSKVSESGDKFSSSKSKSLTPGDYDENFEEFAPNRDEYSKNSTSKIVLVENQAAASTKSPVSMKSFELASQVSTESAEKETETTKISHQSSVNQNTFTKQIASTLSEFPAGTIATNIEGKRPYLYNLSHNAEINSSVSKATDMSVPSSTTIGTTDEFGEVATITFYPEDNTIKLVSLTVHESTLETPTTIVLGQNYSEVSEFTTESGLSLEKSRPSSTSLETTEPSVIAISHLDITSKISSETDEFGEVATVTLFQNQPEQTEAKYGSSKIAEMTHSNEFTENTYTFTDEESTKIVQDEEVLSEPQEIITGRTSTLKSELSESAASPVDKTKTNGEQFSEEFTDLYLERSSVETTKYAFFSKNLEVSESEKFNDQFKITDIVLPEDSTSELPLEYATSSSDSKHLIQSSSLSVDTFITESSKIISPTSSFDNESALEVLAGIDQLLKIFSTTTSYGANQPELEVGGTQTFENVFSFPTEMFSTKIEFEQATPNEPQSVEVTNAEEFVLSSEHFGSKNVYTKSHNAEFYSYTATDRLFINDSMTRFLNPPLLPENSTSFQSPAMTDKFESNKKSSEVFRPELQELFGSTLNTELIGNTTEENEEIEEKNRADQMSKNLAFDLDSADKQNTDDYSNSTDLETERVALNEKSSQEISLRPINEFENTKILSSHRPNKFTQISDSFSLEKQRIDVETSTAMIENESTLHMFDIFSEGENRITLETTQNLPETTETLFESTFHKFDELQVFDHDTTTEKIFFVADNTLDTINVDNLFTSTSLLPEYTSLQIEFDTIEGVSPKITFYEEESTETTINFLDNKTSNLEYTEITETETTEENKEGTTIQSTEFSHLFTDQIEEHPKEPVKEIPNSGTKHNVQTNLKHTTEISNDEVLHHFSHIDENTLCVTCQTNAAVSHDYRGESESHTEKLQEFSQIVPHHKSTQRKGSTKESQHAVSEMTDEEHFLHFAAKDKDLCETCEKIKTPVQSTTKEHNKTETTTVRLKQTEHIDHKDKSQTLHMMEDIGYHLSTQYKGDQFESVFEPHQSKEQDANVTNHMKQDVKGPSSEGLKPKEESQTLHMVEDIKAIATKSESRHTQTSTISITEHTSFTSHNLSATNRNHEEEISASHEKETSKGHEEETTKRLHEETSKDHKEKEMQIFENEKASQTSTSSVKISRTTEYDKLRSTQATYEHSTSHFSDHIEIESTEHKTLPESLKKTAHTSETSIQYSETPGQTEVSQVATHIQTTTSNNETVAVVSQKITITEEASQTTQTYEGTETFQRASEAAQRIESSTNEITATAFKNSEMTEMENQTQMETVEISKETTETLSGTKSTGNFTGSAASKEGTTSEIETPGYFTNVKTEAYHVPVSFNLGLQPSTVGQNEKITSPEQTNVTSAELKYSTREITENLTLLQELKNETSKYSSSMTPQYSEYTSREETKYSADVIETTMHFPIEGSSTIMQEERLSERPATPTVHREEIIEHTSSFTTEFNQDVASSSKEIGTNFQPKEPSSSEHTENIHAETEYESVNISLEKTSAATTNTEYSVQSTRLEQMEVSSSHPTESSKFKHTNYTLSADKVTENPNEESTEQRETLTRPELLEAKSDHRVSGSPKVTEGKQPHSSEVIELSIQFTPEKNTKIIQEENGLSGRPTLPTTEYKEIMSDHHKTVISGGTVSSVKETNYEPYREESTLAENIKHGKEEYSTEQKLVTNYKHISDLKTEGKSTHHNEPSKYAHTEHNFSSEKVAEFKHSTQHSPTEGPNENDVDVDLPHLTNKAENAICEICNHTKRLEHSTFGRESSEYTQQHIVSSTRALYHKEYQSEVPQPTKNIAETSKTTQYKLLETERVSEYSQRGTETRVSGYSFSETSEEMHSTERSSKSHALEYSPEFTKAERLEEKATSSLGLAPENYTSKHISEHTEQVSQPMSEEQITSNTGLISEQSSVHDYLQTSAQSTYIEEFSRVETVTDILENKSTNVAEQTLVIHVSESSPTETIFVTSETGEEYTSTEYEVLKTYGHGVIAETSTEYGILEPHSKYDLVTTEIGQETRHTEYLGEIQSSRPIESSESPEGIGSVEISEESKYSSTPEEAKSKEFSQHFAQSEETASQIAQSTYIKELSRVETVTRILGNKSTNAEGQTLVIHVSESGQTATIVETSETGEEYTSTEYEVLKTYGHGVIAETSTEYGILEQHSKHDLVSTEIGQETRHTEYFGEIQSSRPIESSESPEGIQSVEISEEQEYSSTPEAMKSKEFSQHFAQSKETASQSAQSTYIEEFSRVETVTDILGNKSTNAEGQTLVIHVSESGQTATIVEMSETGEEYTSTEYEELKTYGHGAMEETSTKYGILEPHSKYELVTTEIGQETRHTEYLGEIQSSRPIESSESPEGVGSVEISEEQKYISIPEAMKSKEFSHHSAQSEETASQTAQSTYIEGFSRAETVTKILGNKSTNAEGQTLVIHVSESGQTATIVETSGIGEEYTSTEYEALNTYRHGVIEETSTEYGILEPYSKHDLVTTEIGQETRHTVYLGEIQSSRPIESSESSEGIESVEISEEQKYSSTPEAMKSKEFSQHFAQSEETVSQTAQSTYIEEFSRVETVTDILGNKSTNAEGKTLVIHVSESGQTATIVDTSETGKEYTSTEYEALKTYGHGVMEETSTEYGILEPHSKYDLVTTEIGQETRHTEYVGEIQSRPIELSESPEGIGSVKMSEESKYSSTPEEAKSNEFSQQYAQSEETGSVSIGEGIEYKTTENAPEIERIYSEPGIESTTLEGSSSISVVPEEGHPYGATQYLEEMTSREPSEYSVYSEESASTHINESPEHITAASIETTREISSKFTAEAMDFTSIGTSYSIKEISTATEHAGGNGFMPVVAGEERISSTTHFLGQFESSGTTEYSSKSEESAFNITSEREELTHEIELAQPEHGAEYTEAPQGSASKSTGEQESKATQYLEGAESTETLQVESETVGSEERISTNEAEKTNLGYGVESSESEMMYRTEYVGSSGSPQYIAVPQGSFTFVSTSGEHKSSTIQHLKTESSGSSKDTAQPEKTTSKPAIEDEGSTSTEILPESSGLTQSESIDYHSEENVFNITGEREELTSTENLNEIESTQSEHSTEYNEASQESASESTGEQESTVTQYFGATGTRETLEPEEISYAISVGIEERVSTNEAEKASVESSESVEVLYSTEYLGSSRSPEYTAVSEESFTSVSTSESSTIQHVKTESSEPSNDTSQPEETASKPVVGGEESTSSEILPESSALTQSEAIDSHSTKEGEEIESKESSKYGTHPEEISIFEDNVSKVTTEGAERTTILSYNESVQTHSGHEIETAEASSEFTLANEEIESRITSERTEGGSSTHTVELMSIISTENAYEIEQTNSEYEVEATYAVEIANHSEHFWTMENTELTQLVSTSSVAAQESEETETIESSQDTTYSSEVTFTQSFEESGSTPIVKTETSKFEANVAKLTEEGEGYTTVSAYEIVPTHSVHEVEATETGSALTLEEMGSGITSEHVAEESSIQISEIISTTSIENPYMIEHIYSQYEVKTTEAGEILTQTEHLGTLESSGLKELENTSSVTTEEVERMESETSKFEENVSKLTKEGEGHITVSTYEISRTHSVYEVEATETGSALTLESEIGSGIISEQAAETSSAQSSENIGISSTVNAYVIEHIYSQYEAKTTEAGEILNHTEHFGTLESSGLKQLENTGSVPTEEVEETESRQSAHTEETGYAQSVEEVRSSSESYVSKSEVSKLSTEGESRTSTINAFEILQTHSLHEADTTEAGSIFTLKSKEMGNVITSERIEEKSSTLTIEVVGVTSTKIEQTYSGHEIKATEVAESTGSVLTGIGEEKESIGFSNSEEINFTEAFQETASMLTVKGETSKPQETSKFIAEDEEHRSTVNTYEISQAYSMNELESAESSSIFEIEHKEENRTSAIHSEEAGSTQTVIGFSPTSAGSAYEIEQTYLGHETGTSQIVHITNLITGSIATEEGEQTESRKFSTYVEHSEEISLTQSIEETGSVSTVESETQISETSGSIFITEGKEHTPSVSGYEYEVESTESKSLVTLGSEEMGTITSSNAYETEEIQSGHEVKTTEAVQIPNRTEYLEAMESSDLTQFESAGSISTSEGEEMVGRQSSKHVALSEEIGFTQSVEGESFLSTVNVDEMEKTHLEHVLESTTIVRLSNHTEYHGEMSATEVEEHTTTQQSQSEYEVQATAYIQITNHTEYLGEVESASPQYEPKLTEFEIDKTTEIIQTSNHTEYLGVMESTKVNEYSIERQGTSYVSARPGEGGQSSEVGSILTIEVASYENQNVTQESQSGSTVEEQASENTSGSTQEESEIESALKHVITDLDTETNETVTEERKEEIEQTSKLGGKEETGEAESRGTGSLLTVEGEEFTFTKNEYEIEQTVSEHIVNISTEKVAIGTQEENIMKTTLQQVVSDLSTESHHTEGSLISDEELKKTSPILEYSTTTEETLTQVSVSEIDHGVTGTEGKEGLIKNTVEEQLNSTIHSPVSKITEKTSPKSIHVIEGGVEENFHFGTDNSSLCEICNVTKMAKVTASESTSENFSTQHAAVVNISSPASISANESIWVKTTATKIQQTTNAATFSPITINLPTFFPNSSVFVESFEHFYTTMSYSGSVFDDEEYDTTINTEDFRNMKLKDFDIITEFYPTTELVNETDAYTNISASSEAARTSLIMSTFVISNATDLINLITASSSDVENETSVQLSKTEEVSRTELLNLTESTTPEIMNASGLEISSTSEELESSTELVNLTSEYIETTTSETALGESELTTSEKPEISLGTSNLTTENTESTIVSESSEELETLNQTISEISTSSASNFSESTTGLLNMEITPVEIKGECSLSDFNAKKSCLCSIDNLVKDLRLKSNEKDFHKILDSYLCPKFTSAKNGIVVSKRQSGHIRRKRSSDLHPNLTAAKNGTALKIDSIHNRRKRSYSLEVFTRQTQGVPSNDQLFQGDVNLQDTDYHVYVTPGSKLKISCIGGTNNNNSEEMANSFWTYSDGKHLTEGKMQEKDGSLAIENIIPQDGGNYTCRNGGAKYPHQISVVSLAAYTIGVYIVYEFPGKCSKEYVDPMSRTFPVKFENMICGETHKICYVKINIFCVKAEYVAVNISVIVEPMNVILPTLDINICKISCEQKIYSKIVSILINNLEIFETLPVYYSLDNRKYELKPKPPVESKNATNTTSFTAYPKVSLECFPGFGLLDKTHICRACDHNMYNTGSHPVCIRCPSRQFQPMVGSKACLPCTTYLEDPACLPLPDMDVRTFKILVVSLFGGALLFIILCVCFMCTGKKSSRRRDLHDEEEAQKSNRRRRLKTQDVDNQEIIPLFERKHRRFKRYGEAPNPPPPDFE